MIGHRKRFICKNLDEPITDCFNTGDIIEGVVSGDSITQVTGIKVQCQSRSDFLKGFIKNGVSQYSIPLMGYLWHWEQLP